MRTSTAGPTPKFEVIVLCLDVIHGFMSSTIILYLTDHDCEHLFAQENHNNNCHFQTAGTADSTCIDRKTILSEGVDNESMLKKGKAEKYQPCSMYQNCDIVSGFNSINSTHKPTFAC